MSVVWRSWASGVGSSKQRSRSAGLARARDALVLDPEQGVEDLAGGRRRGRRAEAATLDGDDDDVLRIVGRGQRRVPGLVLLAGLLGRSGLAGDLDRIAAEGRIGRPGRLRGRLP